MLAGVVSVGIGLTIFVDSNFLFGTLIGGGNLKAVILNIKFLVF